MAQSGNAYSVTTRGELNIAANLKRLLHELPTALHHHTADIAAGGRNCRAANPLVGIKWRRLAEADSSADSTPFIEFMLQALQDAMTEALVKTSGNASVKTSGKILALLRDNPLLTIPELALSIGVTERSIERNLQKLQAENRLSRIGPAKGGHWKVIE